MEVRICSGEEYDSLLDSLFAELLQVYFSVLHDWRVERELHARARLASFPLSDPQVPLTVHAGASIVTSIRGDNQVRSSYTSMNGGPCSLVSSLQTGSSSSYLPLWSARYLQVEFFSQPPHQRLTLFSLFRNILPQ